MITVYRLIEDTERIGQVQRATLATKDFGIQQTHGLFGSPDWWREIEEGRLAVETLKGIISRVYMGSMGDWPEFEVTDQNGTDVQSFTRFCRSKEQDAEYRAGRKIEIDYVWQKHKKDWSGGTANTKVILEIRIENDPES